MMHVYIKLHVTLIMKSILTLISMQIFWNGIHVDCRISDILVNMIDALYSISSVGGRSFYLSEIVFLRIQLLLFYDKQ